MASRFMKIKRVIIPFMTLVVMTSQLAGCATVTSDETLKSRNESPDASIEYTIPDAGKQSLDASEVINVGDQQLRVTVTQMGIQTLVDREPRQPRESRAIR